MSSWILDNFPQIAQAMARVIPWDLAFVTTDLEKFTYLDDTKFKLGGVQVGNNFGRGLGSDTTIKNRTVSAFDLDDSHYGTAVKVITAPAFDDDEPDKIAGTYAVAISRQNAFVLQKLSQSYQQSMIEISAAIEENATAASNISNSQQNLHQNIISIQNNADQIIKILEEIKNIADQTKMLGLNAAIEAARAGDAGKGFGVVADEIRKLSDSSKETASQIKSLVESVNQSITVATTSSQTTLKASEEQAAVSQQVSAQIQELTSLMHELNQVAQEI
ncbi:methyl-accepting chemotaxis protein [Syntrophomonas curvata]